MGIRTSPTTILGALTTSGFTLVELMVTISVIGILASIALPNYQNFQARSRQTEAKIVLAGIYTAEMAFFGEHTSYTTCLTTAGFNRTGQGFHYSAGFGTSTATCGSSGAEDCHQINFATPQPCTEGAFPLAGFFIADRSASGPRIDQTEFNTMTTTTIGQTSFKAGAVGRVSTRGSTIIDVWTIDDRKQVVNEVMGL